MTRAAYLAVGESDSIKAEIQRGHRTPDYGALIYALQGKLSSARDSLGTLHRLFNERTDVTHPGEQPRAQT